ncbi:MAG: glycine betaine ABC transporter ATP-binding protein [Chloroflexi bacterium RBG_13_54_9]|nr:MAG: glycine betaine ABC transporter ATP-binding protein [Chloroflexi bacterium RBG_13_54_9]
MIRLEHVVKYYGETIAVDDLSLEVGEGEVCVLIGPSGCGKTTTLRMINRLIEPTSGRIFIDGTDTSKIKPELLRRSIGYAIQSVGLFPHMTVAANIGVVPELVHWDKSRIAGRIEELLVLVGLNPKEYAQKYPNQLSGGEAQRIGVARALAADPPILLMDEPFGAVDPLTREKLQAQFVRIQQELKKTVVLVTHDLDEAIRLADRIAVMELGKIAQYDTPEAVLSKPVNKFVHDFVGTDRALKRLSRINIQDVVRPAPSIAVSASLEDLASALEGAQYVWVVAEDGRLMGWISRTSLSRATSVKQAVVKGNVEEIAILNTATLREALSRMLGQGFNSIPVVDGNGHLLGEVSLHDVEARTAEVGA